MHLDTIKQKHHEAQVESDRLWTVFRDLEKLEAKIPSQETPVQKAQAAWYAANKRTENLAELILIIENENL